MLGDGQKIEAMMADHLRFTKRNGTLKEIVMPNDILLADWFERLKLRSLVVIFAIATIVLSLWASATFRKDLTEWLIGQFLWVRDTDRSTEYWWFDPRYHEPPFNPRYHELPELLGGTIPFVLTWFTMSIALTTIVILMGLLYRPDDAVEDDPSGCPEKCAWTLLGRPLRCAAAVWTRCGIQAAAFAETP